MRYNGRLSTIWLLLSAVMMCNNNHCVSSSLCRRIVHYHSTIIKQQGACEYYMFDFYDVLCRQVWSPLQLPLFSLSVVRQDTYLATHRRLFASHRNQRIVEERREYFRPLVFFLSSFLNRFFVPIYVVAFEIEDIKHTHTTYTHNNQAYYRTMVVDRLMMVGAVYWQAGKYRQHVIVLLFLLSDLITYLCSSIIAS